MESKPSCSRGRFRRVRLTQHRYALIDQGDHDRVSRHKWCAAVHSAHYWYAWTKIDGKMVSMHRFVLKLGRKRSWVDHVNGNGLDNRRANLRLCTPSQNQHNKSARRVKKSCRYKGVSRYAQARGKMWRASLMCKGHAFHLGSFGTPKEAALAYDSAARRLFGSFARTNFPVPERRRCP